MHKVEFTPDAGKALQHVARSDKRLYERLLNAIAAIAEHPHEGKQLRGKWKGCCSYRVGSFRVIYEVRHGELLVLVLDLGPRGDIYR